MKKTSMKALSCIGAAILTISAVSFSVYADAAKTDLPDNIPAQNEMFCQQNGSIKFGKVTSVNGAEITVTVSEFGRKAAGKPGNAPFSEDNENSFAKRTAKQDKPTQVSDGTAPEFDPTNVPEGVGDRTAKHGRHTQPTDGTAPRFDPTNLPEGSDRPKCDKADIPTETVTITVTDNISVKKNGQSATLSDIAADTFVMLVYDDNSSLTEINIVDKNTSDGTKGIGKQNGKNSGKQNRTADGKKSKSAQTEKTE